MRAEVFKIKCKDVIHCIFIICLFQGVISDYIGFRQINYLCDLLILAVLILKVFCNHKMKLNINNKQEYISLILFSIVVVLGWIANSVPLPQALWGIRNYGRFFIFYILACSMWTENDVYKLENILFKSFPIHIFFVAYQYFFEGLKQDFLSGIFGKTAGGNGGLIIYLSIILCIIICRFEYKKISMPKFGLYFILILINSALSELKLMLIVSILLVAWYFIMSRNKGKAMIIVLVAIIFIYIGVQILYYIFPFWANYLTVDNIIKIISDQKVYATANDIGRTAVFSKLSPIICEWAGNDALMLGLGLGAGDYSGTFSFLNSLFYLKYGHMHYTWLSLGYLFVETGFLGVVAYISFFVILEIKAIISYRKKASYYNLLGSFFPLVFMLLIVYNSTMRSNFAYIPFAVLTWQKIMKKSNNRI